MIRSEVLKNLIPIISDQLVVSNIGLPSQELHMLDDQPSNFYMLGTMGLASSIGLGLALVLMTMFMWWRDIIREAEYQGHHTPIVQIGMRYGMMLFISSEVMFFVAFFWAFFDRALFPAGGVWPPEGIITFDPFDLPLINTLVLLLSGCTVTWAHHALVHNESRKDVEWGLLIGVALGLFFTGLQAFEYWELLAHKDWTFGGDKFFSTFF